MKRKRGKGNKTQVKEEFGYGEEGGFYEVRVSDNKVEIEDKPNRRRKWVFDNMTPEYSLLLILMSDMTIGEEEVREKTSSEKEEGLAKADIFISILASQHLIWTDDRFHNGYLELIKEIKDRKVDFLEDGETEEDVLDDLRAEHKAKDIINKEDEAKE